MPGSIKKQGMAGSLRQSIDSGMSRMCPGKTLLLQNIQRLPGLSTVHRVLPDAVLCFESYEYHTEKTLL